METITQKGWWSSKPHPGDFIFENGKVLEVVSAKRTKTSVQLPEGQNPFAEYEVTMVEIQDANT